MVSVTWIMIVILILVLALLGVAIYMKRKYKRPIDFYNLFLIGIVWMVFGVVSDNTSLLILGIVFMAIGAKNKDKWKKNKRKWKDLHKQERILVLVITGILSLLVLAGFVLFMLSF